MSLMPLPQTVDVDAAATVRFRHLRLASGPLASATVRRLLSRLSAVAGFRVTERENGLATVLEVDKGLPHPEAYHLEISSDSVHLRAWRSDVRAEGVIFGVVSLAQKVALGVGLGLLGFVLDRAGYQAGAEQTPRVLTAFHLMVSLVPAAFAFMAATAISRYSIDARRHSELVEQTTARVREA